MCDSVEETMIDYVIYKKGRYDGYFDNKEQLAAFVKKELTNLNEYVLVEKITNVIENDITNNIEVAIDTHISYVIKDATDSIWALCDDKDGILLNLKLLKIRNPTYDFKVIEVRTSTVNKVLNPTVEVKF